MRNRTDAMGLYARDGAAQSLTPRRRPRLPSGGVSASVSATATATAPAPRLGHDEHMAPDLSAPMPARTRARLPIRQRRPATPVPIAPPKVEPLSCRPVPRPRGSSERGARLSPAPLAFSAAEFPFELSSSLSSTSSSASSASSRMTVCADDEETCESSLSEPDLGFEEKGGSMVSVPAGARVREFVGEGSANVVVGIELPEGTPVATRRFFEGMSLAQPLGNPGARIRARGRCRCMC